MANRSLIANTQEDGSIKFVYSRHGATCIAKRPDNLNDKVPVQKIGDFSKERTRKKENFKEFVLEEVDSTVHEGVWLDGELYIPIAKNLLVKCENFIDVKNAQSIIEERLREKTAKLWWLQELLLNGFSSERLKLKIKGERRFIEKEFDEVIDFRDFENKG